MSSRRQHVPTGSPLEAKVEDWEQVATAHGEFFRSIRPANTIMQVVRFIDPDWLVGIEADAVVEGWESSASRQR